MPLIYQTRPEFMSYRLIAGLDEAGRGPWAGPVVAAAVIFPSNYSNDQIDDSKKLSESKREHLYDIIVRDALTVGIGIVEATTIDQINILQATKLAMRLALQNLKLQPDFLMLDAVHLDDLDTPQLSLIKGDQLALPIAAASIIAKVTRDRIMRDLHTKYPQFRFDLHKGYGTTLHLEALKKYGPIIGVHRLSYKPVKRLLP